MQHVSRHSQYDMPTSMADSLPSVGYEIFNERPSPSLSSSQPYTSFPNYTPDSVNTPDTRSARSPTTTYVLEHWSFLMLVFVPIGLTAPYLGYNDFAVFVLNCLAIIPLADVLCRATDKVASFLGETTGALVNVTMGNVAELAIFIQALSQRQYMIVRTSILGSIIVNILLVLGLVVLTGEMQERGQTYNLLATQVAAGLLCLAAVILLVPSAMETSTASAMARVDVISLNRVTSVVLIAVYLLYMWTQIASTKYSYKPLVQSDDAYEPDLNDSVELGKSSILSTTTPSAPATPPSSPISELDSLIGHESYTASGHVPSPSRLRSLTEKASTLVTLARTNTWLDKATAVLLLVVSTGLISVCSGYLVTSIDHFVDLAPISKTTTGLVILPLVGNAAELVSGVMFASRKQTDLAFAVAVGSALQIALFVAPLVVLIAWGMGRDMALDFSEFEAATLAASACLFLMLGFDRTCSVLKGTWLCAGYMIIAVASYFVKD